MARRRENMLEALQASSQRRRSAPGAPPAAPAPPAASSPPRTAAGVPAAPRPAPEGGMTLPLGTVPFLFLQMGLLVLVFSIGYLAGQKGEVSAAEPGEGDIVLETPGDSGPGNVRAGGPRGAQAPLTTPRPTDPGPAGAGGLSEADLAFRDPANTFTVVVFTAENSDFGEERAWKVHEYLSGKGYPVVQPLLWKGEVKIFVGAASSKASLKELEARIRKDPGPNGGRPFYDAYVDKTERFR